MQDLLSQQVKERQGKLEEELTQLRNKVSESEEARRKVETELKEQYEECKVQVSTAYISSADSSAHHVVYSSSRCNWNVISCNSLWRHPNSASRRR